MRYHLTLLFVTALTVIGCTTTTANPKERAANEYAMHSRTCRSAAEIKQRVQFGVSGFVGVANSIDIVIGYDGNAYNNCMQRAGYAPPQIRLGESPVLAPPADQTQTDTPPK